MADGGSLDAAVLRNWVIEARRLLADVDRSAIGDILIGELLSGAPLGQDGIWPCEPIRDLVEELRSTNLERGLITGKTNSRGATWRGVYDGGQQERSLAEQFHGWAEEVGDKWVRVGRMLRAIADSYESEARRWDASADEQADAS